MSPPVVVYYWDTTTNLYKSEGGPDVQPPNYVPPPSGAYPGDPGDGRMYLGISLNLNQETLAHFITRTGWNPGCYRRYYSATGLGGLVSDATADVNADRLPWCSMKLPQSWATMATSAQDGWWENVAQQLSTIPGPVWYTMHHEPHGDGSAADFVAMYNHAVPILHQATNVAVGPILNGFYMTGNGADPDPHVWFCPSADFTAFDQYNQWWTYTNSQNLIGTYGTTEGSHPWRTADAVLEPGQLANTWGKPTACAEYGTHWAWQETNKARQWTADAYEYALANNFRALVWFDQEQNSPRGGWWMEKGCKPTGDGSADDWDVYANTERQEEFLREAALPTSVRLSQVAPAYPA